MSKCEYCGDTSKRRRGAFALVNGKTYKYIACVPSCFEYLVEHYERGEEVPPPVKKKKNETD